MCPRMEASDKEGNGGAGADRGGRMKRIWRAGRMESCFSGGGGHPEKAPRGSCMGKGGDISAGARDVFPQGYVFAVDFIGARGGWRHVPRACGMVGRRTGAAA